MTIRIFLFLLVFIIPLRVLAAVHITEIAWMGVAGDNGQYGEWLELHNDGDSAVSLSGWKIYGDAGGQLLYTFSKSIPAGGYIVAERTTASVPDPIPLINDESGTFGGGGLSNSGEDIALRDAQGTMIESLNFASGWPAGDAATKQTMQWSGTSWITADATPKSATLAQIPDDTEDIETEDTPDTATDTPESSKKMIQSTPKKDVVHPKPHIELTVPRTLIVHTPYKFNPIVYTEKDVNPASGVYRWNFGDGTAVSTYKKLLPSIHTYQYPGTYTLWYGYYANAFDEDPILFVSTDLVVSQPDITVSMIGSTALHIKNNSAAKIDLSNWIIASGQFQSTLPTMTLISPHAQIVITAAALGIPLEEPLEVYAPDGTVFSIQKAQEIAEKEHAAPMLASAVIAMPREPFIPMPVAQPYVPIEIKQNSTRTWMFGAALVTVLALFILLKRF